MNKRKPGSLGNQREDEKQWILNNLKRKKLLLKSPRTKPEQTMNATREKDEHALLRDRECTD